MDIFDAGPAAGVRTPIRSAPMRDSQRLPVRQLMPAKPCPVTGRYASSPTVNIDNFRALLVHAHPNERGLA
ncbi:hypothetical protein ACB264_06090 [Klebsiella pneumoniae]